MLEALRVRGGYKRAENFHSQWEPSIEAQLPFLQAISGPGLRIVPIVVGHLDRASAVRLAGYLAQLIEQSDHRVGLIGCANVAHVGEAFGDASWSTGSTDRATARIRGGKVLNTLLTGPRTGNLKAFLKQGEVSGMSGQWAASVVMLAAKQLGLRQGTLLRHEVDADIDLRDGVVPKDFYGLNASDAGGAIGHAAVAYTYGPIRPPPVPPAIFVAKAQTLADSARFYTQNSTNELPVAKLVEIGECQALWSAASAGRPLAVGMRTVTVGLAAGLRIGQSQLHGTDQFGLDIGLFCDLLHSVLLLNAILGLDFLGLALSRPQVSCQRAPGVRRQRGDPGSAARERRWTRWSVGHGDPGATGARIRCVSGGAGAGSFGHCSRK
jgi:hypothetical protein